jgi:hypothetical protein
MSNVVSITEAKAEGSRLVVSLAGVSGSGKTLTALLLAYGMTNGDGRKVGLLCTENRRGRLYARQKTYEMVRDQLGMDKLPTPFMVGDFEPPFSPDRYIDAILQFQDAGVEVLVIDSVSHEWNGLGGVLEIVDSAEKSIHGWKKATPKHNRFVNTMLQSDMHIIPCVRMERKTDWKDPKNPKDLGLLPIQRDNFMYEMTVSLTLWAGGQSRDVMKTSGTEHIFGEVGQHDGYLTAEHGRKLREWIDGAGKLDAEIERARNTLRTISHEGLAALEAAFKALPAKAKKALKDDGTIDTLKQAATAFDQQRKEGKPGGAALADLNKEVMGDGAQE